MLKTKFYLKEAKKRSSLLVCVIFYHSRKLLTISTGIIISPKEWNIRKQEFKNSSEFYEEGNAVLNNLRKKVLKLSTKIDSIENIEELKLFLKSELVGETASKKAMTFVEYFDQYYHEKLKRVAEGTLKVYKVLPEKLISYQKIKSITLTFNYWNVKTLSEFSDYLFEQGYLNDTVNNNIKALKAFLNWGYKTLHNNQSYKGYKVKWENHNVISLTLSELNKVYEHDFSNNQTLNNVRDIFCMGCYTTQRFSDLQQLESSQIRDNYWFLSSAKTKKLLTIPLNKKALLILGKHKYQLPKISNQKFNSYIKEVARLVGIDAQIQKVSFSGNKKICINAPKYDLISSHTARRTGITLLIENGTPLPIIQKITGHSNIKTLLRYDGTSLNSLFNYLDKL